MISNQSDNFLVNLVKEKQDNEAIKELINRHSGVYLQIVSSYKCPELEKNDLIESKAYNIYNCALNYKLDSNMKFSTYVGQMAKWTCLNKSYKHMEMEDILGFENLVSKQDSNSNEEIERFIIKSAKEIGNKLFYKVVQLRFFNVREDGETSWQEIGDKLGISHEGARKIYYQYLPMLKQRILKEYE